MEEPGGPRPLVQRVSWRSVILAALVGALVGYGLFVGLSVFGRELPRLTVVVVLTIAVVAAIVGWLAYLTNRTIHVRLETMPPQQAMVMLALGKTSLIAGAALAGGYAAIVVHALPQLDAAYPRERALYAGLAAVAAVGLVIAGRLLERACEIPKAPPDDSNATPGELPDAEEPRG